MLSIELPWMMAVVGLMVVYGIFALVGVAKSKNRDQNGK